MRLKISVCIPAYRSKTIQQAVASIISQTWTNWELIIVGQGNDSKLEELGYGLPKTDPRILYFHLDRAGSSIARNIGIAAATGDVVAFMDDDCTARADWLETLNACFSAESSVSVVSGNLIPPAKADSHLFATCPRMSVAEALYDPIKSSCKPPKSWDIVGANMAIRRHILRQIGDFDENLGPGSVFPAGEDIDYKFRLEAAGVKMRSTPRSVIFHTSGYRYGIKDVFRHYAAYSLGNGALAGKLTLLGDYRGEEWLERMRHNYRFGWVKKYKPYLMPLSYINYVNFKKGYKSCISKFELDPMQQVLRKKEQQLKIAWEMAKI